MRIKMGRHQFIVQKHGGFRRFVEKIAETRYGMKPQVNWIPAGDAVQAFITNGDWAAKCPDCPEVIVVDNEHPFWCPACQNAKNDGAARPLVFPENREQIEAILLKRISPTNRNWLAGETIEDLQAENDSHPNEVMP